MKLRFQWFVDNAVMLILGGFVALMVAVQLIANGVTVYRTVIQPAGVADPNARGVVVGVVILIGLLLARLRYKQHKIYGLLQLGLAAMAAWSLAAHPVSADALGNTVALCGVALLAARGFYDEGEPDWRRLDEESKQEAKRRVADKAEREVVKAEIEEASARLAKLEAVLMETIDSRNKSPNRVDPQN